MLDVLRVYLRGFLIERRIVGFFVLKFRVFIFLFNLFFELLLFTLQGSVHRVKS